MKLESGGAAVVSAPERSAPDTVHHDNTTTSIVRVGFVCAFIVGRRQARSWFTGYGRSRTASFPRVREQPGQDSPEQLSHGCEVAARDVRREESQIDVVGRPPVIGGEVKELLPPAILGFMERQ